MIFLNIPLLDLTTIGSHSAELLNTYFLESNITKGGFYKYTLLSLCWLDAARGIYDIIFNNILYMMLYISMESENKTKMINNSAFKVANHQEYFPPGRYATIQ